MQRGKPSKVPGILNSRSWRRRCLGQISERAYGLWKRPQSSQPRGVRRISQLCLEEYLRPKQPVSYRHPQASLSGLCGLPTARKGAVGSWGGLLWKTEGKRRWSKCPLAKEGPWQSSKCLPTSSPGSSDHVLLTPPQREAK